MKFAIRAALAALSIGSIPPAFAEESGPNPNTFFTERPGVIAEAPAQNAPATTQRGQELQGHGPAQACVCRLKYFAHATDTDQAFEEIRPDLISGSEWHRRILRTLPASE